jgi:hypothetical protein
VVDDFAPYLTDVVSKNRGLRWIKPIILENALIK